MEETPTQKQTHDIAIALIQKDIEYIKKSVSDVSLAIATMDKNFARHEDVTAIGTTLKEMTALIDKKANHSDLEALVKVIDTKVSKEEFKPIQTTLSRVNWLMISFIVGGLLTLLYNAGK